MYSITIETYKEKLSLNTIIRGILILENGKSFNLRYEFNAEDSSINYENRIISRLMECRKFYLEDKRNLDEDR